MSSADSVLFYARGQLGKPYHLGATPRARGQAAATPASYDCSSLVLSAFRYARVEGVIGDSRLARQQYAYLKGRGKVDTSSPAPGDLSFYGSGGSITHVGIVVDSANTLSALTDRGVSIQPTRGLTVPFVAYGHTELGPAVSLYTDPTTAPAYVEPANRDALSADAKTLYDRMTSKWVGRKWRDLPGINGLFDDQAMDAIQDDVQRYVGASDDTLVTDRAALILADCMVRKQGPGGAGPGGWDPGRIPGDAMSGLAAAIGPALQSAVWLLAILVLFLLGLYTLTHSED